MNTGSIKAFGKKHPLLTGGLLLIIFVAGLVGLAATAFANLYFNKGVSYGPDHPRVPYTQPGDLGANPLGINTFLHLESAENEDRILDLVKAGGYGFIRQIFPWEDIETQKGQPDWSKYDAIVDKAQARGIQVIARLDRPPTWSRLQVMDNLNPELKRTVTGPPDNLDDWSNFVAAAVAHYKGKVKYFQIWNEPNLDVEWNAQRVNPGGYVNLLKVAYERAKAANPDSVIIMAALSPTDQDGPQYNNLNDLKYLDQFYAAGGAKYFDILAAQAYGLGYSPDFRFTEPDFRFKDLKRVNFSRLADTRQVMEKWQDFAKPVWVTEYGWVSIPPQADWKSTLHPWGDNVSEQTQADYLVGGIERARREWPWLGVMNVWFIKADQDLLNRQDAFGEARFFAMVNPDWSVRPAYTALQKYAASNYKIAGTGWHGLNDPAMSLSGSSLKFTFSGQRLDLVDYAATSEFELKIRIDSKDSSVKLAPGGKTTKLADGLSDGQHTLEITSLPGGVTVNGLYVSRENSLGWLYPVLLAGFGLIALIGGLGTGFMTARVMVWLWPRLLAGKAAWPEQSWQRLERITPFGLILGLLLFYFAGPFPLAVAGIVLLVPLAFIRPDWMVFLAVFTAPLYMHARNLRESLSPFDTLHNLIEIRDPNNLPKNPLEFTLFEILVVIAVAAWAVSAFFALLRTRKITLNRAISVQWLKNQGPFALPLVLFLLAGAISLLTPEPNHLREAIREFRIVIVEPLLLYLLAVRFIRREWQLVRLFDLLAIGGVLIALAGIYQFLFTKDNTVSAEGVSRVISIFSHPDNLGLYLGRVIPLVTAVAFFSNNTEGLAKRRWWYMAALLPILATLILSFSRGAWIASALALLVMVLIAGSRKGLIVYGIGALGLVAALPFVKLERITSLFNVVAGSSNTRLNVWQSALEMIKDHPLTGIGLDQFLYKYQFEYVKPEAWLERFISHPHNVLLDYWLRLGIMGPILLAWLLVVYFRVAVPLARRKKADRKVSVRQTMALGLTGSMVDFLAHGLVDNSYFLVDLAAVFCLSFALIEIFRREKRSEPVQPEIAPVGLQSLT